MGSDSSKPQQPQPRRDVPARKACPEPPPLLSIVAFWDADNIAVPKLPPHNLLSRDALRFMEALKDRCIHLAGPGKWKPVFESAQAYSILQLHPDSTQWVQQANIRPFVVPNPKNKPERTDHKIIAAICSIPEKPAEVAARVLVVLSSDSDFVEAAMKQLENGRATHLLAIHNPTTRPVYPTDDARIATMTMQELLRYSQAAPSAPATSAAPSTPATSAAHSAPATSAAPSTPATSAAPSAPATSAAPSTPATSAAPATPAAPAAPATPAAPAAPSTLATSAAPSVSASPATKATFKFNSPKTTRPFHVRNAVLHILGQLPPGDSLSTLSLAKHASKRMYGAGVPALTDQDIARMTGSKVCTSWEVLLRQTGGIQEIKPTHPGCSSRWALRTGKFSSSSPTSTSTSSSPSSGTIAAAETKAAAAPQPAAFVPMPPPQAIIAATVNVLCQQSSEMAPIPVEARLPSLVAAELGMPHPISNELMLATFGVTWTAFVGGIGPFIRVHGLPAVAWFAPAAAAPQAPLPVPFGGHHHQPALPLPHGAHHLPAHPQPLGAYHPLHLAYGTPSAAKVSSPPPHGANHQLGAPPPPPPPPQHAPAPPAPLQQHAPPPPPPPQQQQKPHGVAAGSQVLDEKKLLGAVRTIVASAAFGYMRLEQLPSRVGRLLGKPYPLTNDVLAKKGVAESWTELLRRDKGLEVRRLEAHKPNMVVVLKQTKG
jgi:hypothetical protein